MTFLPELIFLPEMWKLYFDRKGFSEVILMIKIASFNAMLQTFFKKVIWEINVQTRMIKFGL